MQASLFPQIRRKKSFNGRLICPLEERSCCYGKISHRCFAQGCSTIYSVIDDLDWLLQMSEDEVYNVSQQRYMIKNKLYENLVLLLTCPVLSTIENGQIVKRIEYSIFRYQSIQRNSKSPILKLG